MHWLKRFLTLLVVSSTIETNSGLRLAPLHSRSNQSKSSLLTFPKAKALKNAESVASLSGSSTKLFSSPYEEEQSGVSLKVLAVSVLGIFGLFGSDIIGGISGIAKQQVQQSRSSVTKAPELKKATSEKNRGALTRLTRKEINEKLSRVPLFYCSSDGGKSVFVTANADAGADSPRLGFFFTEKKDAEEYASGRNSLTVSATTMDQVYFPMLVKKQKMGSFVEGVAGSSDPTAIYKLRASPRDLKEATDEWRSTHPVDNVIGGDTPLYRVANLAFQKEEGLEIPLFMHKDDAITSFKRLQESKQQATENNAATLAQADIQISSINDILSIFSSGGFEGRALEFYPSVQSLEDANQLIN